MIVEALCAAVIALGMHNADNACKHMETVVEASKQYDVDPALMVALIYVESRWTDNAKSNAGACGLTQVIPKWTGGKATGGKKYTCSQLQQNPKLSIEVGTQIYSWWLRKYAYCKPNKWCSPQRRKISLCGYNAGFRCKDRDGVQANTAGMNYARVVLRRESIIKRKMRQLREKQ